MLTRHHIAHAFVGPGLDLEMRLYLVRRIFTLSDYTTVPPEGPLDRTGRRARIRQGRSLLRAGATGLCEAAGCPSPSRDDERCDRQEGPAAFAKLGLPLLAEAGHVGTPGTDAAGERLPPLFEARVL